MNATPSYYIIAYDLHQPGQNYKLVEEKIAQLEETCKILNTTWIAKTKRTAREIFDLVKPALDQNDCIFIAKTDLSTSMWRLKSSVAPWINAHK